MPVEHYENFPVASLLVPAALRPAIETVYKFARSADDIADEGDATLEQRLAALTEYETALVRIQQNRLATSPLFQQLTEVISCYQLPFSPFFDLLDAFKQDLTIKRYASFIELLEYCRRSANPVGVLMLHLYDAVTPANIHDANQICSALQLINFWQDIENDWQRGRVYIPQQDLKTFNVAENDIAGGHVTPQWRQLLGFEIQRSRALLLAGAPLALRLPGRIGWELRLIVQGGLRILEKIEAIEYDVFQKRPTLNKSDWGRLLWRTLMMRSSLK